MTNSVILRAIILFPFCRQGQFAGGQIPEGGKKNGAQYLDCARYKWIKWKAINLGFRW